MNAENFQLYQSTYITLIFDILKIKWLILVLSFGFLSDECGFVIDEVKFIMK